MIRFTGHSIGMGGKGRGRETDRDTERETKSERESILECSGNMQWVLLESSAEYCSAHVCEETTQGQKMNYKK